MRRLLQFGTSLFLMATLLAPLVECFDGWDDPGLANDTEFGLFALALVLCLVLVVCMLIAARCLRNELVLGRPVQLRAEKKVFFASSIVGIFIPPRLTPLQI